MSDPMSDGVAEALAEGVSEPQPTNPDGSPIPVPEDAPVDTDALEARIAGLEDALAVSEAKLAAAEATIAELEADPYRPAADAQLGEVTPQLLAYEEASFRAEVQAWERDTGLSYDDPDPTEDPDEAETVDA